MTTETSFIPILFFSSDPDLIYIDALWETLKLIREDYYGRIKRYEVQVDCRTLYIFCIASVIGICT